jgi:mRNA interferase HicA
VKKRDLERHLTAHGCSLVRQASGHELWENASSGQRTTVPRHREIKTFNGARDLQITGYP